MLTKSNFQDLPHYKRRYALGDQVFCIPTWSGGNNPVHAVVINPLPNDYHNVLIWTADGEVEAEVVYCRPDIATIGVAWRTMLAIDASSQAPSTEYRATVICESPIVEDILMERQTVVA